MRKLSFRGFLDRYLKELSGQETNSIRKLFRLSLTKNARLKEPLFLYALALDNLALLLEVSKGTTLDEEYNRLARQFNSLENFVVACENDGESVPNNYKKVYTSYLRVANKTASERETALLMLGKTKRLMGKKKLSAYRLYTDLGLNPGNVNAFLKNGDPSKVSLATARRLLDYAEKA